MTVTPPPTAHLTLRGVDFAYTSTGDGPLVLNLHGLSSSRRATRATGLPDFGEVAAAGRRLVSYDARGHGESSGTAEQNDYVWAELALDLLSLADELSPDAPIAGIGTSMGTGTLLHAVTQRPERFSALVLGAPPTAWQTRAAQSEMYRTMADTVEKTEPAVLARMMAAMPVPAVFEGLPGFPGAPDISAELMPTVFRGAGLTDLPSIEAIARIGVPTLVLAWAGDPGHPVTTAEAVHGAIAGSQLHVSETSADLATWGDRAAAFLSGRPVAGSQ